ncbi:MAG TPA: HAD-IA family hydrolase [Pyrinomonadaceae bacterium]|jgi:phosphoglycolate phosphatase|nr:HAD-IA family hydrolase [Pyrinomonadaceae bacterium]
MTKMGATRAVIFDFDYTLADSSEGIVECINYALAEMGLACAERDAACRTIGLHLNDTFIKLAGQGQAARCDEFRRLFGRRADEVMTPRTVVYETAPPVLKELRERGLKLGIVSTKFRFRIEEILRRDELLDSFDVILGGEDVERHKPHPEGLYKALERIACPPASVLYVGDSLADAEVAQRAAVPFAAVLSGVTPREEFDGYGAVAVLDDLSQLPRLVGR